MKSQTEHFTKQEASMKIFLSLLLLLFLSSCTKEKASKHENTTGEVNIEKSDEKVEVNDKNLPLPVNENK